MAFEVGSITLGVGVAYQQAIADLKKIDTFATKMTRDQGRDYTRWWREALRERDKVERQQSDYHVARLRAEGKAERDETKKNADWWLASRRARITVIRAEFAAYAEGQRTAMKNDMDIARVHMVEHRKKIARIRAEYAAYEDAKRGERRADMELAGSHMAEHRRRLAIGKAETAAYIEEARRRKAATAALNASMLAGYKQSANQLRAQSAAAAAQARQARASARISSSGNASFGIGGLGLGSIGLAALGGKLVTTANDMQVIQQRLTQVSDSSEEVDLVFNKLAASSQRLRQPLGQMSELYTKLRQSNENVGLSVNETLKVTEAFSAALRLSGATGQTAASALLQFGQAMAKGNLDGDEFRTIAENNSEVLLVLQRRYGKTREQILAMREAGQLTARMMADALTAEFDNLIDRANKLEPTLSQGATAISNSMLIVMTNSKDAREAVAKLGTALAGIADFIQENGPIIMGFAKMAALAWSVHKAVTGIEALLAGGALVKVLSRFGLGASAGTAFAIAEGTDMFGKKRLAGEELAKKNKVLAMSEKDLTSMIYRNAEAMAKAQAIIDEIGRKKQYSRGGEVVVNTEIVDAAKKEILLAQEALRLKAAARKMDAKGVVSPPKVDPKKPGKTTATKEDKDTTDEEIKTLLALYEAGELNEQGLERLTTLRDEAQFALNNLSASETYSKEQAEELAKSLERVGQINGVLNPMIELNSEAIDTQAELLDALNEGYENLSVAMKKVADERTMKAIKDMSGELHQAQKELFNAVLVEPDHESAAVLLTKVVKLQAKIAELQQKLAERNGTGMGTGGEPTEGKKIEPTWLERANDALDRHTKRLNRSILDTFLSAPSELIGTYFESMANDIANGGNTVGASMQKALGQLASSAGKQMIELGMAKLTKIALGSIGKMMVKMGTATAGFGKFLTAIKTALSNPLIAGPALLAIGIGLAAYGAKMGAIGSGSGNEAGGGIGGLAVGGTGQGLPQRYVFGNRSNPLGGERTAVGREQSVVVNQTIIGANDPVAQRQIMSMIDNAQRRGLGNGANGRSV